MIQGVHTMFYTSQPEATRAFFRDKLGFPFTDVGEGWLIFEVPEADVGFHPAEAEKGAVSGTPSISFYCDDIGKTMAELQARGVEFTGPVEDHGYGLVAFFKAPGDFAIQLYQPRYVKNFQSAPPLIESPPAAQPMRESPPAEPKPRAVSPKPKKSAPIKKAPVKKAAKRPAVKPVKTIAKKAKKAKGRRR